LFSEINKRYKTETKKKELLAGLYQPFVVETLFEHQKCLIILLLMHSIGGMTITKLKWLKTFIKFS
jgi:hypothetical protein